MSAASPCPLPGSSATFDLCGVPTQVSCLRYADRVFLSVTQLASFGSLIAAASVRTADGHAEPTTRVLLGDRGDDLATVAALRLLAAIECVQGVLGGLVGDHGRGAGGGAGRAWRSVRGALQRRV